MRRVRDLALGVALWTALDLESGAQGGICHGLQVAELPSRRNLIQVS